jgi:hypothetical protein
MIPPFQENGYLPPGLHVAIIDEVEQRFGQESELRRVQMESVRWMVDLAVRAGVERIVLNGSFVTDIMEPNDVDCVLAANETRKSSRSRIGRKVGTRAAVSRHCHGWTTRF